MLITLIVSMTLIAMVVYVLKKETNILGKRYDKEYETDFTKGLAWAVWSYLWWGGCAVSMIMSYVSDEWSFCDMFLLWIGTTLLYAALVAAWSVIRKERVDALYSTNKVHTPEKIFEALNVEVKEKTENEDNTKAYYWVAYQGGHFCFTFMEDSRWVDIHFANFYDCKYEHINKALMIANSINFNNRGWCCYLTMSDDETSEKPLGASLSYTFSTNGSLVQIKQSLEAMMQLAFHIARDFSAQLDEAIKKDEDKNEAFFTDIAFHNNIARIQWMKTMDKLGEEKEENSNSSALSVNRLVNLFDNADFGCLQSLRIVCGEAVEMVTDISAIEVFDIREYVRQRPDASTIESINLTFGFEYQEMFMNLTKAKASTDKSLIFVVNIIRSGSELDVHMDNRIPFSSRTMLEVRLTDEDKDYWEAKYMVDEAMDMAKNGHLDKLTSEQQLVVAHTDPSVQTDLYWGKKFYNNRCYFQALYHFNRVFTYFKNNPNNWNEGISNLYCEVAFYIGFIYNDLGLYDRAFFYLYIAQRTRIDGTQEFVNCLCNMKDVGAKGYIHDQAEEVMKQMKKSEEEAERLTPLYNFLRRRYAYVLIDRGELDDAERMLNDMIADEQDVEFAKGELEYLHEIRRNAEENASTKESGEDK
ncbi:MAG: hypothetical protein IJ013_02435 [Bacteroidaceae bacterium]|nr:hypothetical protein [Bacteroidaceae bacterium]